MQLRVASLTGFAAVVLLGITACGRGFEYEGGDGSTGPGTVEVEDCGSGADTESGFNIAGTVVDLETGEPLALADGDEPLCLVAVDPTPAITGGEPEDLAASSMCSDGTFLIAGIAEIPVIGVMVQVNECGEGEDTVMRTVTGVASDEFDGKSAGFTFEGVIAHSVSASYRDQMAADAEYEGDLELDGFLGGFVEDEAELPVSGATVTCGACADTPTFYMDANPDDGLFSDGAGFNETTDADSNAMFMIPGAIITTYTCDDGGVHSWPGELFGSLSGYGVFISFTAE